MSEKGISTFKSTTSLNPLQTSALHGPGHKLTQNGSSVAQNIFSQHMRKSKSNSSQKDNIHVPASMTIAIIASNTVGRNGLLSSSSGSQSLHYKTASSQTAQMPCQSLQKPATAEMKSLKLGAIDCRTAKTSVQPSANSQKQASQATTAQLPATTLQKPANQLLSQTMSVSSSSMVVLNKGEERKRSEAAKLL